MIDLRTDVPRIHHRLIAALRFVDVFTDQLVRVPLQVSVPALEQTLLARHSEGTYRFVVSGPSGEAVTIPPDTYDVEVVAPGGEYRRFEPLRIDLPGPFAVHPPPVLRSDYLHTALLWPTRRATLPVNETAVVAIVTDAGGEPVPGLRVEIHDPTPPPVVPFTFTDERGEMLFRLPGRPSRDEDGNAIPAIDLVITASDDTGPRTVSPNAFAIPPGAVSLVRFTLS